MSRASNGTYTAPTNTFNPAVEGTAIDEGDWNTTLDDIETALTDSLSVSGKGKITAHIDFDENASPGTPAANVGRLYVTDVAGVTTLKFKDASGTDYNLLLTSPGLAYTFSTSTTTTADPGSGIIRFNNATLASVTEIAVDDNDANGADLSSYVLSWDDRGTTNRGTLIIQNRTAPANVAIFTISGASTDESGWTRLAVTYVTSAGSFSASTPLGVTFSSVGPAGNQVGVGRWSFSTTTTSGPSTGTIRLNHATIASATAIYIHETDADSRSLGSEINTWDDSTSTIKTKLLLQKADTSGTFALFNVTALTDNGSDDSLTVTYVAGSGTFSASDSILVLPLRTGDLGATGADGGLPYTFNSTTTTSSDPGAGLWRANNATLASATELAISYNSAATGNPSISTFVKSWDDSTSTVMGTLTITKSGAPQNIAVYQVTALNDQTTYGRFTVTNVASAGSFSTSDSCLFVFSRTGDKGDTGSTGSTGSTGAAGSNGTDPGIRWLFASSTTMADPSAGNIRFNNATIASATAAAVSYSSGETGNPSVSAYVQAWDDSSSTAHRGYLIFKKASAPQNFAVFDVTGALTDNTTWAELALTYVTGSGTFSASDTLSVQFERTGDAGTGSLSGMTANGAMYATGASAGTSTAAMTDGQVLIGRTGTTPAVSALSGDVTMTNAGVTAIGATKVTNAMLAGSIDLTTKVTGTLPVGNGGTGITALGTGVATALGINVGSAGALVTFNGALGTPSSGTLTNATGLPVSTGISGLGTGVATALAVNVGSAGAFVTFNGAGGTPSSITLTNATGLPVSGITASTSTALGVGSVELGHATDTTISRTAAGLIAVEGVAVKLAGIETVYIPASAMTTRTTNGAAAGTVETTTNKVMFSTLDFDTTTQEFAQFAIRMPKSWNESTVTARFTWSHASTTTNFGVVWALEAVSLSDAEAGDTAFGTAQQIADTGGTTNMLYITSATPAMTVGSSPAAEDWVVFQVKRVPSDGSDTMAVDARLHGVTIYITTDAATDA